MMTALVIVAAIVGGITALALILPCKACRLRRERMKKAYAQWQAQRGQK